MSEKLRKRFRKHLIDEGVETAPFRGFCPIAIQYRSRYIEVVHVTFIGNLSTTTVIPYVLIVFSHYIVQGCLGLKSIKRTVQIARILRSNMSNPNVLQHAPSKAALKRGASANRNGPRKSRQRDREFLKVTTSIQNTILGAINSCAHAQMPKATGMPHVLVPYFLALATFRQSIHFDHVPGHKQPVGLAKACGGKKSI